MEKTWQQFSDVTFCETGATEKNCCLCCDFVWVSIVMQFWNAEDLLTHALQETVSEKSLLPLM